MGTGHSLGMLATMEAGEARLRPLELTFIDGAWWAPISRRLMHAIEASASTPVELLLFDNATDQRVCCTLACSTAIADRQQLRRIRKRTSGASPFRDCQAVLKLTPAEAESRTTHIDTDLPWDKAA